MARGRRGNGEGSIYQKNGRWCGQFTIGRNEDGTLKLKYVYGKTRREVADKINSYVTDINKNVFIEPSTILVNDWMKLFLDRYKKNSVKPNTYAKYHGLLKNHISKEIGWFKLQELRSNHIQKLYNDMVERKISPSTIRHVHILLYQGLEQAVKERYIFLNPAAATNKPAVIKSDVEVLSVENQKKLLDSLTNDDIGITIKLALSTGLRIGEILELKWSDFDLLKREVNITRTLARVRNLNSTTKSKTTLELTSLKSKASRRIIPLSNELIIAITQYKVWQDDTNQILGITNNEDLLFCSNTTSSGYANIDRFTDRFHDILKDNDIPYIKFHALRHTFATRILEADVHPKVAQELLGHASCSITLDIYSHVLPNKKRDAIDKLYNVLNAQKVK